MIANRHRVSILFDNFGPYHLARLRAVSAACDLLAVEFGRSSSEYDWNREEVDGLQRVAVNPDGFARELNRKEFDDRLFKILDKFQPEVVFIPGWGTQEALSALRWCMDRHIPMVLMSESTEWDQPRHAIKEWMKRRIVSLFSAALVGGSPHRDYMQKLGMERSSIFLGYDAVDNFFFKKKGDEIKKEEGSGFGSGNFLEGVNVPQQMPYFLASARFIEKKNLNRLIKAYAQYRRNTASSIRNSEFTAYDLVLLGDGPLRSKLTGLIRDLRLQDSIHLPGFRQYEELPPYYANAAAFIHTSTTEQWGLVVNEAMASGLPVLVSNRCGCAPDLVQEGVNGWTFDPTDEEQIAELMLTVSSDSSLKEEMGEKSRMIIANWGTARFTQGAVEAMNVALSAKKRRCGLVGHLIISLAFR